MSSQSRLGVLALDRRPWLPRQTSLAWEPDVFASRAARKSRCPWRARVQVAGAHLPGVTGLGLGLNKRPLSITQRRRTRPGRRRTEALSPSGYTMTVLPAGLANCDNRRPTPATELLGATTYAGLVGYRSSREPARPSFYGPESKTLVDGIARFAGLEPRPCRTSSQAI
jgi:hypothetical protein